MVTRASQTTRKCARNATQRTHAMHACNARNATPEISTPSCKVCNSNQRTVRRVCVRACTCTRARARARARTSRLSQATACNARAHITSLATPQTTSRVVRAATQRTPTVTASDRTLHTSLLGRHRKQESLRTKTTAGSNASRTLHAARLVLVHQHTHAPTHARTLTRSRHTRAA